MSARVLQPRLVLMTVPARRVGAPTRGPLVLRRVGQSDGTDTTDPNAGSTDMTGGSTDTGSNLTGNDPNLGTGGSGSDWFSQATSAISSFFSGNSGGSSGSSGSTDQPTSPQTSDTPTNNAAVPAVTPPSAPSGISPTTLAIGAGVVAIAGIGIYAASHSGKKRRR
jgi:hypothetical protein